MSEEADKKTAGPSDRDLYYWLWVIFILAGTGLFVDGLFAMSINGYHGEIRSAIGAAMFAFAMLMLWRDLD